MTVLDKFPKIVRQELILDLLDGLRAENGQFIKLARVKSTLDRVVLGPLVVSTGVLG